MKKFFITVRIFIDVLVFWIFVNVINSKTSVGPRKMISLLIVGLDMSCDIIKQKSKYPSQTTYIRTAGLDRDYGPRKLSCIYKYRTITHSFLVISHIYEFHLPAF